MPKLILEHLYKQFESFCLEDINIEVFSGKVHILVGENGSGKSTLMRVLSGYYPPDKGQIIYKGTPQVFQSIYDARNKGVHYLPQDVQSFDNLSIAENIYFNSKSGKTGLFNIYKGNQIHSNCIQVFNDFGIKINPSEKLGKLGLAERQIVSAVKALVIPSDVVIFDEPSSAMNDPDREILFKIVERLKQEDRAIIYITHRMDEILRLGDWVSILHKGKIVESCRCASLSRKDILGMMTGEVHRERFPKISHCKGEEILRIENLVKTPILKDINLSLKRGEILGITGLMGSGRSMLAHCLFGVLQPDGGTMIIQGKPISFRHPVDAINAGISLIPEERTEDGIFPEHDLIRNLTCATLKRFVNRHIIDDAMMGESSKKYIRELSILPGRLSDKLLNYSGGNQQKVLVSRWLMNRSRIYIMDEPTRGIDAASKVDIYNSMNDLVSKGASIILISSEIEEILGMSDRILVLAEGIIKGNISAKEATKELILELATIDK